MLVLTRRVGESIVIGNDITVTVLEVKGDQIRLGIDAPRHVQVHREEIVAALRQANQSAVLPSGAVPSTRPVPASAKGRARRVA